MGDDPQTQPHMGTPRQGAGGRASPRKGMIMTQSLEGNAVSTAKPLLPASVQFPLFPKHFVLAHRTPGENGENNCSVFPLHNAKIKPCHNIILAICSEIMLSIFRMLIMGSGGIFSGPNSSVIKLNIHVSEGN